MKPAEFKQHVGNQLRKIRVEQQAKVASLHSISAYSNPNTYKNEEELIQKLIRKIIKCFIFIQDHGLTLYPREKGRFKIPIM